MEACVAVEREVDKVLSKFSTISDHSAKTLQDLIWHIEELKREIEMGPAENQLVPTQSMILSQALNRVKDAVGRVATEHRDLHGTVSKVGKAIDRNFLSEFTATSRENVFSGPDKQQLLNEVICQHFFRQGVLDIGEKLAKESNLSLTSDSKGPFLELNKIIDSLKQRDLEPALDWAEDHREKLLEFNSSLEFKLHRLQYIKILNSGRERQNDAINYARLHFPRFIPQHTRDIQSLMGGLLFANQDISKSPYCHLLDSTLWVEICDLFTRDACSLLGLSVDSPLAVCVNAGCIALPSLLNIRQVMQVTGIWSGKDELPIEIDLGKEYQYHSIFACPILRQQSSDTNPPMRLICGHCISRDALNKLSNGNKLKCPYCPMEQSPCEAMQIHF